MITTARLITGAALMRTESRGAHFRSDFPEADLAQARRSVFTLRTAEAQARSAIMTDHEAYA
jgi:L-aspartate oxidase